MAITGALFAICVSLPHIANAQESTNYRIDAYLDIDGDRIVADATLEAPPHILDEAGTILLDVSNVRVDSLTTPSGLVVPFEGPDERGVVTARLPSESSANHSIVVYYSIELDASDLESFGYYLFMSIGPGSYWYPDVVLPDSSRERFHDFDVTLTYPKTWAVLTSGQRNEQIHQDGWIRDHYRIEHVEGFALIAGEGFRTTYDEGGSVPIVAFFHPDYADSFSQVIERTAEAASWYERTYGFFPIPVVGILQGHPRWGGGFPLPNIFMVHLGRLDPDFLAYITAHELGHYYWGLHVLGDQERLDWLVLANGIWADQLYLAERSDRTLEQQWRYRGNGDWMLDYLTAMVANHEQGLGLTREDESELGFDYNSLIRHGKAAIGVYLQSRRIGVEPFLDLQRRLLEEFRHRPMPVEAFVQRLEQAGAEDASQFFEEWRRGDATIGLALQKVERNASGSGYEILLQRTGRVPYPIDLDVETDGGETTRHTVPASSSRDTLRTETRPRAVRIDPDGILPMWNSSHPEIRALLVEALARARLNPMFLREVRAYLAEYPDDERMLSLLMRRLHELGHWEEAASLWQDRAGCSSAIECLAGMSAALSLSSLDRHSAARAVLQGLQDDAFTFGLKAAWNRYSTMVEERAPRR